MKYYINLLTIGIGLLCIAATALPTLAAPTGTIDRHVIYVKNFPRQPNGMQRVPEVNVNVRFTFRNPDPTDARVSIGVQTSLKNGLQTTYQSGPSGGAEYTIAAGNTTGVQDSFLLAEIPLFPDTSYLSVAKLNYLV